MPVCTSCSRGVRAGAELCYSCGVAVGAKRAGGPASPLRAALQRAPGRPRRQGRVVSESASGQASRFCSSVRHC